MVLSELPENNTSVLAARPHDMHETNPVSRRQKQYIKRAGR